MKHLYLIRAVASVPLLLAVLLPVTSLNLATKGIARLGYSASPYFRIDDDLDPIRVAVDQVRASRADGLQAWGAAL